MITPSDPYYFSTVLHLPFDTDLYDKSVGYGQVTAYGNAAISSTTKMYGDGSLLLDGPGDYVSVPDGGKFVFGTEDFTLEAWIKTSVTNKMLFDKWNGSSGSWQVWITGSGVVTLFVTSSSAITGTTNVCNGAWNHVAITRESGQLRIFVNGVLDAPAVTYTTSLRYNAATFYVGAQGISRNSTYDFNGYIDDVRVTRGVARYTSDFTPPGAIEYFDLYDLANINLYVTESVTYAPYAPPANTQLTLSATSFGAIRGGTEFGGRGRIAGTVKNKADPVDTPVYRRVRLIYDRDGSCLAETWSDPSTGNYVFENINPTLKYTVLSYDHTGQFRAVAADSLTPETF